MLLKIVKIGESGALILPEELMEHAHLAVDDTVLVTRDAGGLLMTVRPASRKPRACWKSAKTFASSMKPLVPREEACRITQLGRKGTTTSSIT